MQKESFREPVCRGFVGGRVRYWLESYEHGPLVLRHYKNPQETYANGSIPIFVQKIPNSCTPLQYALHHVAQNPLKASLRTPTRSHRNRNWVMESQQNRPGILDRIPSFSLLTHEQQQQYHFLGISMIPTIFPRYFLNMKQIECEP